MNFSDGDFDYTDHDLLEFLGKQESQKIQWGNAWQDQLLAEFEKPVETTGAAMPWPTVDHLMRFRPREVTIHAGHNGNFKSVVTGQMAMWFAQQDEPAGIMSFEMPVAITQKRMCQQAAASKYPSRDFIQRWSKWNDRHLAYYDHLDTNPSSKVLGAVFYMAKDLGCKHILIDSLTKCGLPYGERGAEKDFIDALCATAKAFDIHIHLVCHMRKPDGKAGDRPPTKWDVRGAGELTDLVDNVIVHWADKKKADLVRRMDTMNYQPTPQEQELLLKPDQLFLVEKQRHGAFEGGIGLEMHESMQFHKGKPLKFNLPEMEVTA